MKTRVLKVIFLAMVILMLAVNAVAETTITTTVVMRVSRMTQRAVVNVGEDLTMEVNIDGVVPASYQWFFNDVPLAGADQKVYCIADAQVEDTGVYRMDAFDADGKMLVSMDISARVIDNTVPKSGDTSLPVAYAGGAMGVATIGLVLALRRRTVA